MHEILALMTDSFSAIIFRVSNASIFTLLLGNERPLTVIDIDGIACASDLTFSSLGVIFMAAKDRFCYQAIPNLGML
jgi:hypothetical protein